MADFILIADLFQAGILTMAVLSGVACVPVFPLTLELIAEATYPVNQAASASIVYLWSGLIGSMMIGAELGLDPRSSVDSENQADSVQTCSAAGDSAHEVAKDYSSYVYFLIGCIAALEVIYVCGFYPEMKRSKADRLALSVAKDQEEQS